MKLMATYNRDKKLNVREKPNGDIIREMKHGETVEVIEIKDGWCELADGSFINSSFVDLFTSKEEIEPNVTKEADEEVEEIDDDASELRKMKVSELKDLAEKSGIEIQSGAKKNEIIEAILADE